MTTITLKTITGKLNRIGDAAFFDALRQAKAEGNREMDLPHWFFQVLMRPNSDVSAAFAHFGLDRVRALEDLSGALVSLRKSAGGTPGVAEDFEELLDRAWHYASLAFNEDQIRTGHTLIAALKARPMRQALVEASRVFAGLDPDRLSAEAAAAFAKSDEGNLGPKDGSARPAPAAAGGAAAGAPGPDTALGKFSVDLTAQAAAGKMDPIMGRDEEIRQVIDVLMRRRQNNPILTGEAGVGKTAVVEGFAQRLVAGDVPPALRGVRLHALDIGLMQAGASVKGEFEQRLRSVIDEVQGSAVPIILFIDEAHTLIGAGGAAGTGDAANLLKPALARGTLRTVAATTWAEYRQYFEKDPALTRRFQPVSVEEPSIERASTMLRGLTAPMEAHHKVRIADEAVVAAVALSARYLPARQLPDKAVSLLDTACARVAISQSATPGRLTDLRAHIAALKAEIAAKEAQRDLGATNEDRLAEARRDLETAEADLGPLEASYAEEKALVDEITALRARLAPPADDAAPSEPADPEETPEAIRARLAERIAALAARDPDGRMVYPHVDENVVAAVISDWTGIPAGRMVSDALQAILNLGERLKERVIGQDHGLDMIARRIETSRAKLGNPEKPIGVFMLCGPSGVGKTETALALAEAVYGGDQNIITINMSEFQEAHTVSLLKGAPPGYVGYGEGGRLTEAVRRKPYSVVLLDEVEKAHPDVHELFFQVFDKGVMEDGSGRRINFRNTLILLTSNVGTEVIMAAAARGDARPDPEALAEALRPALLRVFPPALIGRIVTIPYYPLSADMLEGIVRLKLKAIVKRMKAQHNAALDFDPAVIGAIVDRCRDPDSGGRMVDNIITNTILPDLSREVLRRMVWAEPFARVTVALAEDGRFTYGFA